MSTKTTFQATSRSGEVVTRTTEAHYTHAVDNGRTILSFHQSFAAAQRRARSGQRVVEAIEVSRHESKPRQARSDFHMPAVAAKFFAGKLHPGEEPRTVRVVQSWDDNLKEWVVRTSPEIITIGFAKACASAGLTKLALSDGVVTADFTIDELKRG